MSKSKTICRQGDNFDPHQENNSQLTKAIKQLMGLRSHLAPFENISQVPKPSFQAAKELIILAQQILFPGFFSPRPVTEMAIEYHIGQLMHLFYEKLSQEVAKSIRHDCRRYQRPCLDCHQRSLEVALEVTLEIPRLKEILATDVVAAQEGDPAAGDHFDQIILCYPGLFAVMVQRLAFELYKRQVPFLPRILTEYAHGKTGIDIHPGAQIGPHFFIDHGTGVVIGETTTIGARVRLYQGVTLGALSLPRDARVRLQGKKRHPTLEDGVIVYAGATILGGNTIIGADSVVGGNVWLTESVPPGTKVLMKNPEPLLINGAPKNCPGRGLPQCPAIPMAGVTSKAKVKTVAKATAKTRKKATNPED